MRVFRRLLLDYPQTRDEIIRQAKADGGVLPAVLRGEIWAAILDVGSDALVQEQYDAIDKEQPTTSDRQISVDIPRCHQYNRLIASTEGREKLRRILKAWVLTGEELVYWQGLDSLAAPFLSLNFHSEARAFACLRTLVQRYVYQFFLPDNSEGMESRLALFKQLLTYHDPELALHMGEIGFVPELYAIPWFLTMFSHVLPLEKIYRLWDCLFLNSPHYVLYFALGFLKQMRQFLLTADFNSTMVFFSTLQYSDVRKCIEDAENIANHTPRSVVEPAHLKTSHYLHRNKKEGEQQQQQQEKEMEQAWEKLMTPTDFKAEVCPRVSVQDLVSSLSSIAVIIDVRKDELFERCHISTCIHIPKYRMEDKLLAAVKFKKGLPIVIVSESFGGEKNNKKKNNEKKKKNNEDEDEDEDDNDKEDHQENREEEDEKEYANLVASTLVQQKYPYVSILSGGMQAVEKHVFENIPSLMQQGISFKIVYK